MPAPIMVMRAAIQTARRPWRSGSERGPGETGGTARSFLGGLAERRDDSGLRLPKVDGKTGSGMRRSPDPSGGSNPTLRAAENTGPGQRFNPEFSGRQPRSGTPGDG